MWFKAFFHFDYNAIKSLSSIFLYFVSLSLSFSLSLLLFFALSPLIFLYSFKTLSSGPGWSDVRSPYSSLRRCDPVAIFCQVILFSLIFWWCCLVCTLFLFTLPSRWLLCIIMERSKANQSIQSIDYYDPIQW